MIRSNSCFSNIPMEYLFKSVLEYAQSTIQFSVKLKKISKIIFIIEQNNSDTLFIKYKKFYSIKKEIQALYDVFEYYCDPNTHGLNLYDYDLKEKWIQINIYNKKELKNY